MVIYVIYLLFLGIVIGIIAVWKYSGWVINQYKIVTSFNFRSDLKVEHIYYDHQDYYAETRYIPRRDFERQSYAQFSYMQEVIDGDEHKKHLINEMAYSLTTKMVDDGIVDVRDIRDETHPFMRLLQIKVRVYRKRDMKSLKQ